MDKILYYAKKAAEIVKSGGVIVYPTDTLYGFGADATNKSAVEKIRTIKGSGPEKNYLLMVRDIAMLKEYSDISHYEEKLLEHFWPGPLSIELPLKIEKRNELGNREVSGFRMPDHPFREEFFNYFDRPITSTSVNISGENPLTNATDIKKRFQEIDYVVDAGECNNPPSTLIKMEGSMVIILREGAVSKEKIKVVAQKLLGNSHQ